MQEAKDRNQAAPGDRMPEDIELDEAGRNWVYRHGANQAPSSLRRMAADAAVTSAIGQAYGQA